MEIGFKIIAAVGLLGISGGVLRKNYRQKNLLFALGGLFLLVYSIYLKDPVFVPLQFIFIGSSLYELFKSPNQKN